MDFIPGRRDSPIPAPLWRKQIEERMDGIESEDGSGMSEAPELSVTQSPMGYIPPIPFAPPMALTHSRQSGRGGIPR